MCTYRVARVNRLSTYNNIYVHTGWRELINTRRVTTCVHTEWPELIDTRRVTTCVHTEWRELISTRRVTTSVDIQSGPS